jgi:hypothetical protein
VAAVDASNAAEKAVSACHSLIEVAKLFDARAVVEVEAEAVIL